jgi:predicted transposase/invertase (TIGR01784 family)
MVLLECTFVGRRFRRKESDLIWQIPGRGGAPVYLYLLLEFQSTNDHFMALRMRRYTDEFYEYLLQTEKPSPRFLPPVFPVLVYNGRRPWTAPTDIAELIFPKLGPAWTDSFRYYRIIEREIPDAELLRLKSAVSAIFYLENSSPEELGDRLRDLVEAIRDLDHPTIRLLTDWINDYLKDLPENEANHAIIEETFPPTGGPSMFETALKGYIAIEKKKAIREGREEGREEGRQEGILENKRRTLARQLERRFAIAAAERTRVLACLDGERLDQALDLILDAPDAATVLRVIDG